MIKYSGKYFVILLFLTAPAISLSAQNALQDENNALLKSESLKVDSMPNPFKNTFLSAQSQPGFSDPDMTVIFNRITPHFNHCAGSPIPGMTRGLNPFKNDGFYVGKPEMVMPTGSGTLSCMVSYGDNLELQLTHAGYFNSISDNKNESKVEDYSYNTLLSPGHISIELPNASSREIAKFDQRIDFARGSVILELETHEGSIRIEVAGDMKEDNLVISVKDTRRIHGDATIRYENWRNSMVVTGSTGKLMGAEEADVSKVKGWQAQSMSLALQMGCMKGNSFKTDANKNAGTITVPNSALNDFTFIISAKPAHGKPPVKMTANSWNETAGISPIELEKARLEWWKDFWSHSWLDITGDQADYLTRLWYITLYSYACVAQGSIPGRYNGGPGLVFKDSRAWGDVYVWQNQREISFWPMTTAGHPEFTRKSILFFNHEFDDAQENAKNHKMSGVLLMEDSNPRKWNTPFGEYPLVENKLSGFDLDKINPLAALQKRKAKSEGYNELNFSAGFEFTNAVFDYVQYEGDNEIAHKIAAPWLKGETLMCLSLLTKEGDGKYHIQCADATEEWWKVNDPMPLVSGAHYVLEMTVLHGKSLGFDDAFISSAKERLDNLVPLPAVASWNYTAKNKNGNYWEDAPVGNIIAGDNLLAPFDLSEGIINHNAENPELYAIFPFALVDLNSTPADLKKGIESFNHRYFKNTCGWSQCGIQAARLGLPNTVDVILEHARNHQEWPYGGWNSPADLLYQGGNVVDCPYFDAAGVNMTALQESLLQSHSALNDSQLFESGPIHLVPAVSEKWSGQFLLHARGGFAVRVKFTNGKPDAASFEATRDAKLLIFNPFERTSVWLDGKLSKTTEKIISFDVKRGQRVFISPLLNLE